MLGLPHNETVLLKKIHSIFKEKNHFIWFILVIVLFGIASASVLNKPKNPICSDNYVDWDIAVDALSQHFSNLAKENPNVDFGPAEIERHFAENCEEDLKIYNKYIDSWDWAEGFFKRRIRKLVGDEKYKDIIRYYIYPEEFSGCEDYQFEPQSKGSNDTQISRLLTEKKYEEAILLSDMYLKDSEVWYCDPYFWTQRAQAFHNLNNCAQALADAAHAFAVAPSTNGDDDPQKELYYSISSSANCKID